MSGEYDPAEFGELRGMVKQLTKNIDQLIHEINADRQAYLQIRNEERNYNDARFKRGEDRMTKIENLWMTSLASVKGGAAIVFLIFTLMTATVYQAGNFLYGLITGHK
jgi:hypothetical protein